MQLSLDDSYIVAVYVHESPHTSEKGTLAVIALQGNCATNTRRSDDDVCLYISALLHDQAFVALEKNSYLGAHLHRQQAA